MDIHALGRGLESVRAGGHARGDEAGEHVAGAGRRQPGVARGIDRGRLPRPGGDAARALEHRHAAETADQFAAGGQPVGLHCRRCAAQQARRFQRMRRDHGGPAAAAAGLQQRLQLRVRRDRIQRVGIEHQGPGSGQDARQHCADRVAAAAAAGDCHPIQRQRLPGPEHQCGLRRVVRRCGAVQQAREDAAGPGMQRGGCRQQHGARHAGRATDHRDVAIAAFVRVMQPGAGRRRAGEESGGLPATGPRSRDRRTRLRRLRPGRRR